MKCPYSCQHPTIIFLRLLSHQPVFNIMEIVKLIRYFLACLDFTLGDEYLVNVQQIFRIVLDGSGFLLKSLNYADIHYFLKKLVADLPHLQLQRRTFPDYSYLKFLIGNDLIPAVKLMIIFSLLAQFKSI